jgi:hypothetical protein
MKEVRYFSATNFKKFMMGLGFPTHSYNKNVLAKDFIETFNFAIISIGNVECEKVGDNDVDLWLNGPDNHWIPSCSNVLNINFNDITNDKDGAITSSQAKEIVDFFLRNEDKRVFYIHCGAGISRSGAVASFIYDYFRNRDISIKIEPKYPEMLNYFVKKKINDYLNVSVG